MLSTIIATEITYNLRPENIQFHNYKQVIDRNVLGSHIKFLNVHHLLETVKVIFTLIIIFHANAPYV